MLLLIVELFLFGNPLRWLHMDVGMTNQQRLFRELNVEIRIHNDQQQPDKR